MVHTQNIENAWMRMKGKSKRQFRTRREVFPTYRNEFMWRRAAVEINFFVFLFVWITFLLVIIETCPY